MNINNVYTGLYSLLKLFNFNDEVVVIIAIKTCPAGRMDIGLWSKYFMYLIKYVNLKYQVACYCASAFSALLTFSARRCALLAVVVFSSQEPSICT